MLGLLFVGICGALACASLPVPLVAEIGSSVVIPVDAERGIPIGYGGSAYPDVQRGELEFWLGTPGGSTPKLTTRVSTVVLPAASSEQARGAINGGSIRQIVSLVDIPADPGLVGHHDIHVRLAPAYGSPSGTLRTIPIDIVDASGIDGTPTPLEGCQAWVGGLCADIAFFGGIETAVPDPEIIVRLEAPVFALDVTVTFVHFFPNTAIEVVDVIETVTDHLSHRAVTFWEITSADSMQTVVRVEAIAAGPDHPFDEISLVFRNVGNVPFTPGTGGSPELNGININNLRAYDEVGELISLALPTILAR